MQLYANAFSALLVCRESSSMSLQNNFESAYLSALKAYNVIN